VLEVLQSKHPAMREPPTLGDPDGVFEPYPSVPDIVPTVVTSDIVKEVSSKLSGTAGPGGTDSKAIKTWLLRYGAESHTLCSKMAAFTKWLANAHPPWAAYRALMACRLVALDKQLGVCPLGISEIYRRLLAKYLLGVSGHHATQACDNFDLCAGLRASIEGAAHAVQEAWQGDPAGPPTGAAAAVPIPDQAPPLRLKTWTPKTHTVPSWWMLPMASTSLVGKPCSGPSATGGPMVPSSSPIATVTPPSLSSGASLAPNAPSFSPVRE